MTVSFEAILQPCKNDISLLIIAQSYALRYEFLIFSILWDNGKQGKLTEHDLFVKIAQFKICGRTASDTKKESIRKKPIQNHL